MPDAVATETSSGFLERLVHSLGPLGWLIVLLGLVLVACGVASFFVGRRGFCLAHLFASFLPLAIGLVGLVTSVRAFEVLATAANVKPSEVGAAIEAGLAQGIAGSAATLTSGLLAAVRITLFSFSRRQ